MYIYIYIYSVPIPRGIDTSFFYKPFLKTRTGAGVGDTEVAKCHNGKPAVVKVKHESWEVRGMAGGFTGEAVVHVADGLASKKSSRQCMDQFILKENNGRHDLVHEIKSELMNMMDGGDGIKEYKLKVVDV